jgi:homoserine kinase
MLESSGMESNSVAVRVPTTSANLGPGFDCLGMALALTADVRLEARERGLETSKATIENLVVEGARSLYKAAGRKSPPGLAVRWQGEIPIGRGLGASATARAAGLVAANALCRADLSREDLLTLGAELEGHADNMAPALFGGLQVVVRVGDGYLHQPLPLPEGLKVVLFVPDFVMPTRESRRLLPKKLSREDAVYNIGRAALLIAALSQRRLDVLDEAMRDRLHQPARGQLLTGMDAIMNEAREAGALAAYLSGGGSTIAALATEHEEVIARAMSRAARAHGHSGTTIVTEPSLEGAAIISEDGSS